MLRPWVIGHRGASALAPENSLAAFALAVAAQADAIEADVRLSADGIPVLCHDPDLQRLAGRAESVTALSAEALGQVSLRHPSTGAETAEGIPRLDRTLQQFPEIPFFLEMKGDGITDPKARLRLATATALAARAAVAQGAKPPFLLSFHADLLASAQEVAPEFRCGLNMEHPDEAPWDFLSCSFRTLVSSFVSRAQSNGQPVLAFTVNDLTAMRGSLARGIDGIYSDDPAWLKAALGTHFGDPPA